jgi:hypothetical protein
METQTNKITETRHYSNPATYAVATAITKAAGTVLGLLPRAIRVSLYEWAYIKENAMRDERLITGRYPLRTWYGITGVDQYDLVADFVMLNAYKGGVR